MTNKRLNKLIISPSIWPDKELQVQPGDLSQFAPYGNGVYGYQKSFIEPIKGDPPTVDSAGLVYFGNELSRKDFNGFLRMMDVSTNNKGYAAFVQESSNPIQDHYLNQMRLVSKFGLSFMFNVLNQENFDSFDEQELSIEESLWGFIEAEKENYGISFGDPRIEGKMGGRWTFCKRRTQFWIYVREQLL